MPTQYTSFKIKNTGAVAMVIEANDPDGTVHSVGTIDPGEVSIQLASIDVTWSTEFVSPAAQENVEAPAKIEPTLLLEPPKAEKGSATAASGPSKPGASIARSPLQDDNIEPTKYEAFLKLETGTHSAPITQLLATPDGKTLISAGESTIRVWDVETREQVRMLLGQIGDRIFDGTIGSGNIERIALSHNGKWIVALTFWLSDESDLGKVTDVHVYELATGNLQAGFRYPGQLQNLDFSPDDMYLAMTGKSKQAGTYHTVVAIYDVDHILDGGSSKIPVPVASDALHDDALTQVSVRFVPTSQQTPADYRIVVATSSQQETENRTGKLIWYSFSPAGGLTQSVSCNTEEDIDPDSLAVSHEFVVVANISLTRHPQNKQFSCHDHEGEPKAPVLTESRPAVLAFSRDGSRLIVGLATDSALSGDKIVQVKVYDTAYRQFQLRSTYYGHDDSVGAVALLQDGTAVSSGGDQYAIHFWSPAHSEGEQIGVIKRVGRVVHAVGLNTAEQIGFGTQPYRLTGSRGSRQIIFDLRTMTLRALSPNDPDDFEFATPKWMILDSTGQIISLKYVEDTKDKPAVDVDSLSLQQQVEWYKPDLNLFVGADDEWVIWSKSGYYNASQHGDRRIGYHVNRGADKEALYFPSDRFKAFYRPDIIHAIVEHGSEDRTRAQGIAIPEIDISQILPPIVELTENGVTATEEVVTLVFTVKALNLNNDVTRVWIVQNEQFACESRDQQGKYTVKLPLLPGRNRIKIIAEDATAKSNPIELSMWRDAPQPGELSGGSETARGDLSPAPGSASTTLIGDREHPAGSKGTLYVLAVGVSTLANQHAPFKNLRFADSDAIAIFNAFAKGVFSSAEANSNPLKNAAFQAVNATLLLNEEATKVGINSTVDEICSKIREHHRKEPANRDVLLVFLSGHGVVSDTDQELYFWNYDLNFDDKVNTGLAFMELGKKITSLPAEVILVTDACHAGMAGSEVVKGIDPNELAKRIYGINERGMYIFNAARSYESAIEAGWFKDENENKVTIDHGYFTKSIIEVLENNTKVTMLKLIDYVQLRVPYYTLDNGNTRQTPVFRMYGDLLPLVVYEVSSGT